MKFVFWPTTYYLSILTLHKTLKFVYLHSNCHCLGSIQTRYMTPTNRWIVSRLEEFYVEYGLKNKLLQLNYFAWSFFLRLLCAELGLEYGPF